MIPKKSLGQNFLSNPRILGKIVNAAEITKNDVVLEIGPGTGNLTRLLTEKAGKIIAVEKDHRLIEKLRQNMPGNVETIEADILKFNPTDWKLETGNWKLIGNIPYYLTSHLLRIIFESANWRVARPELIVLTVQKEVAQRITAKPPDMSILAVSVQFYADVKIVGYISKKSFHPSPKVDSAILKLVPKAELLNSNFNNSALKTFFNIVRLGFSNKRKKLLNNLAGKFDKTLLDKTFTEIGLGSNVRAEELSIDNWLKLAKKLS